MAQISTLWVPPCSRAGPSARSRARSKQVPREGGKGRKGQEGPGAQLGGKIQHQLVAGYVPLGGAVRYPRRLGDSGAGAQPRLCPGTPACRATSVAPSWGGGKGQCEVVRGRRQQLDELEFLSGRGAGGGSPGRSWQGQPTIGDGWTEGRTVRAPACLCLACLPLARLLVPRLVGG